MFHILKTTHRTFIQKTVLKTSFVSVLDQQRDLLNAQNIELNALRSKPKKVEIKQQFKPKTDISIDLSLNKNTKARNEKLDTFTFKPKNKKVVEDDEESLDDNLFKFEDFLEDDCEEVYFRN